MADFRDYQPILFSIYRTLSKQRTSAKYLQIRASGCDCFELSMQAGKIQDMQFRSDLSIHRAVGEKKNAWKSASADVSDFSFLNQWEQSFELLQAKAKSSEDPRPGFSENPKVEELTHGLVHYDSEVAQMIPAVIYHRMFQLLSGVLEKGYLVDFKTQWLHGASFLNGKPMNFAWVDANGFGFVPQTRIDESVCIYHLERPRLRRYWQSSIWKVSQLEDLMPIVDDMEAVKNASLLAWSRKNFDRIVLLPQAVASILTGLISAVMDGKLDLPAIPQISSEIELVDEPENELFALEELIDSDGKCVKARSLLTNGVISASDSKEKVVYAPILRRVSPSDLLDVSLAGISSAFSEKILFIEKADLRIIGKECFVFMPSGGVLYRQKKCLGHVIAPLNGFSLSELLVKSLPVGNPVRIGGVACCALEVSV